LSLINTLTITEDNSFVLPFRYLFLEGQNWIYKSF